MTAQMPAARPRVPYFSSGPTTKRPGWTLDALSGAALGRSHRSAAGKAKLAQAIELTRKVLRVPADYRIGIVPGSDTGAVEMAMWSMLGPKTVEVMAWASLALPSAERCERPSAAPERASRLQPGCLVVGPDEK